MLVSRNGFFQSFGICLWFDQFGCYHAHGWTMLVEAFEILGQFMSLSLSLSLSSHECVCFWWNGSLSLDFLHKQCYCLFATMVHHHFSPAFRRFFDFCPTTFSKSKSMMFNGTLIASETSLSHGVTEIPTVTSRLKIGGLTSSPQKGDGQTRSLESFFHVLRFPSYRSLFLGW